MTVPPSSVASPSQLGYVGRVPGQARDSDSWYSPPELMTLARAWLGGHIDLDPFTSVAANRVVQAKELLTEEDDAFTCPWPAVRTGWCNPPYGRGLIERAVLRWLVEWRNGTIRDRGLLIAPCRCDTRWWQDLAAAATGIVFIRGRIKFWNEDGKRDQGANTAGSTLFLFAHELDWTPLDGLGVCATVVSQTEEATPAPPTGT